MCCYILEIVFSSKQDDPGLRRCGEAGVYDVTWASGYTREEGVLSWLLTFVE